MPSGSLDAEWHRKHPMPKNPTLEERIRWHVSHAKHCGCRPIPEGLSRAIRDRSR
jgi:hypothetical protein